jgi:WD40 repeat protein
VWARNTGSLLSTLQGHKDYINKICVTQDNKTILSAAQDGVRFFDLENMNSLGGYKTESIMDIGEVIDKKTNESSVIFANQKKLYVLPVSTIRGSKKGKIETYDFKIYNFASKLHENSVNTTTLTITPEGMVFLGFSEGQIIMFDFHKLNDAKPQPFNDMDEDLDKI